MRRVGSATALGAAFAIVLGGAPAAPAAALERASLAPGGREANGASFLPALGAGGRLVAFVSEATNLDPRDRNGPGLDVFVHDRTTGSVRLLSRRSDGAQAGDVDRFRPGLSRDGRVAAWSAFAPELAGGSFEPQVFVSRLRDGKLRLASVSSRGVPADGASFAPSLSDRGRYVAFDSWARNLAPRRLTAPDTGNVFVHDRTTGRTELLTRGRGRRPANGYSVGAVISATGRVVAFSSTSSNLVRRDRNRADDVFVAARVSGRITRVSVSSRGGAGNGSSYAASISADGRRVAFQSLADNLVPGDRNGAQDCFVRDRRRGRTILVHVSSQGRQGNSGCFDPVITRGGRFVAFSSFASNLVPGDTNGPDGFGSDVFLHDLRTRRTVRLDVAAGGGEPGPGHATPAIAARGRVIAWASSAANLVAGDRNRVQDVVVLVR